MSEPQGKDRGRGLRSRFRRRPTTSDAPADGTVYEHTASGPAVDPAPQPEPAAEAPREIPAFVEYTPSEVRTYLLGAAVVLASVAAARTLFVVAQEPDSVGLTLLACLAAFAALAGWALASWTPTIVSIRDGILEVTRGAREQHFDLRDPDTTVELGTRPGSPSWKTTLTSPDGDTAVIGARQVKARHFIEIVEWHRTRLRRPEAAATAADDSR